MPQHENTMLSRDNTISFCTFNIALSHHHIAPWHCFFALALFDENKKMPYENVLLPFTTPTHFGNTCSRKKRIRKYFDCRISVSLMPYLKAIAWCFEIIVRRYDGVMLPVPCRTLSLRLLFTSFRCFGLTRLIHVVSRQNRSNTMTEYDIYCYRDIASTHRLNHYIAWSRYRDTPMAPTDHCLFDQ